MSTSTGIPERIGPYRVLRPIARGGMAEVYEVEEQASGEHLALKLLVQAGGAAKRFNREYEAMTRLNHPHIVRVYHYGFHKGQPWLTMELIEGTPIQAYAKRMGRPGTPKRNREVIRVVHDLALALDHIHMQGLIHRDLKSANVLVLPDGRVKLLDFGTAKVIDAVEGITKDGEFVGTFAYASPEQLTGKTIDHRADLYSLGVLLYRLATGKRPFDAEELHELARQHVKQKPRPPRELVPALSKELQAVILALLEKKPRNRPQTGRDVAEALERLSGEALMLPDTLDVDLSGDRLVGREDQLAEMRAFLDVSRSASVVLAIGPEGSGRQQLMQATHREVEVRGWSAFSCGFRRGGDDLDSVARLLLSVADSLGAQPSTGAATASEVIRSVARDTTVNAARRREVLRSTGSLLLKERADATALPVVVLLRSLQHAGPVGFDVFVGLREELKDHDPPIFFVAECLETADDPQSLARKRLPDAHRVRLGALGVREVALLVGSLLNRRPPPTSMARRIHKASGGLPTYVEEVVKGMVADGILAVQGRDVNRIEWAQREQMFIPVPGGAEQRVLEGLARLPVDRRRVLEALALAGGETHVNVLAAGLESTAEELEPAIEELSSRGWVNVEVDDGQTYLTWRQLLAEQVVLEQLHPARRRVICDLVVDEIANEAPYAAQIRLLLEVGRTKDAVTRGIDWGLHHLAHNRPVTALHVLDPLADALAGCEGINNFDRARVHLLHTTCLLLARPTDHKLGRSFLKAQQFGKQEGSLFQAELELTRARIQRVIGHYPSYEKHLMAAWELVRGGDASPLGATIASQLGWIKRSFGQLEQAAAWAGNARRMAVELKDQRLMAQSDVVVAGWQYAQGQLAECERTAASAVNTFGRANDTRGLSLALPVWVDSLRHQGRYSDALKVLYKQLPRMRELEAPTFYVRLLIATGWCEMDLGRLGRAQECVDELAATLRPGEHLHLRLESNLMWSRIMIASGQVRDAYGLLSEVRQKAQAAGLVVLAQSADAVLGEVLWAMGEPDEAIEKFHRSVVELTKAGEIPAALDACIARSRALADQVPAEELFEAVKDFLDNPLAVRGQLERQLAEVRYAAKNGSGLRVTRPLKKALLTLEKISAQLSDTDRAAMRVHPWARHLRLAGLAMGGGRASA